MIRKYLLVFSLICLLVSSFKSFAQGVTPFHIWNHSLLLSLDSVRRFGVMESALLMRYQDDSTVAVSLVDVASLPMDSDKSASELLAAVYGEEPPEDPQLKRAHANNLEGALEHRTYQSGPLYIYFYRYKDKEIAYVADPQDEQRFLTVESSGREIKMVLDSLTRR